MRRLEFMTHTSAQQLTLWNVGSQQLLVDFSGGRIVSDTGLLSVRQLDRSLGVLHGLAQLLPDPRSPKFRHHSTETLLTQQVYQIRWIPRPQRR
jgi:hypothetical protein